MTTFPHQHHNHTTASLAPPRPQAVSAATIGYGVDVMQSTITIAGLGLFATRDFKTNEIITEYAGCIMSDKFQAARCEVQTHMVRVSAAYNRQLGQDIYVDGGRTPVTGRGGRSFANHSKKANAEPHPRDGKVFLQARAPIASKSEIFAYYGADRRVMMGEAHYQETTDSDGRSSVSVVLIQPRSSKRVRTR